MTDGHAQREVSLRPLGVVAGNGSLPQMVLKGALRENRRVVVAGLRGEVHDEVLQMANEAQEFALGSLAAIIDFLKSKGCLLYTSPSPRD